MDNTYTAALIESNLEGREKLCLLGMIFFMNNEDKTTFISQENLAVATGVGKNTTIRALKQLEDWGVIQHIGDHAANPSAPLRTTKIYKIQLDRLRQLKKSGMVPGEGMVPVKRVSNSHSDVPAGGEIAASPLCGVDVPSEARRKNPVQYSTVSQVASLEDQQPDQKQHQEQDPVHSGTPSPIPSRDATQTSRTQAAPSGKTTPHKDVPPAAPHLTQPQQQTLVTIYFETSGLEPKGEDLNEAYDSLAKYNGPFSDGQLAVIMWWAFVLSRGNSGYWYKDEAWKFGRSMANFLGASRKMNEQFGGWRNEIRDKTMKMFPTAMDVWKKIDPDKKKTPRAFDDTDESHTWTTESPASPDGSECCSVCGISRLVAYGVVCEPSEEALARVSKAFEVEE